MKVGILLHLSMHVWYVLSSALDAFYFMTPVSPRLLYISICLETICIHPCYIIATSGRVSDTQRSPGTHALICDSPPVNPRFFFSRPHTLKLQP